MKKIIVKFIPIKCRKYFRQLIHQRIVKNPKIKKFTSKDTNILDCMIAYNNYGGYCVPISSLHRPAAQKIILGEVFEPKTLDFIKKTYLSGDIIHAGTYFGDFLPVLSKICGSEFKVWAFEPNPINFRCALITKIINNLTNIELFNLALGKENSSADLMVIDKHGKDLGGGSRLADFKKFGLSDHIDQFVRVQKKSLDLIIPNDRKIALIQLDVEGYEKEVLIGAKYLISKWKPILILETVPEVSWFYDNILDLGYKFEGMVNMNSIFISR